MNSALPPGWYIQLLGNKVDLEDWLHALTKPFDPVAIKDEHGSYLLSSKDFALAKEATDIREKAKAVVARLNGAMSITHRSGPISCGGVYLIDGDGRRHVTVFAEMGVISLGRIAMRATAVAIGPNGEPLPPPPPQPSTAQSWNDFSTKNDDIADLLEQHGKSNGWYEIYKTIELAEHIVGGKHKLEKLLGEACHDFRNIRQTANFYRHARAPRPVVLTNLIDAKSLLNFIVRTVIEKRLER